MLHQQLLYLDASQAEIDWIIKFLHVELATNIFKINYDTNSL